MYYITSSLKVAIYADYHASSAGGLNCTVAQNQRDIINMTMIRLELLYDPVVLEQKLRTEENEYFNITILLFHTQVEFQLLINLPQHFYLDISLGD